MIIVKTKKGNFGMSNSTFKDWIIHGKMPYKILINRRWIYPYMVKEVIKDLPTTSDYLAHYDITFILEKNLDSLLKLIEDNKILITSHSELEEREAKKR